MKNNQKSAAKFVILVIIVVVILVGYYFYSKNKSGVENKVNSIQNADVSFKTFNSNKSGSQVNFIEFNYPETWEVFPNGNNKFYLAKEDPSSATNRDRISKQIPYIEILLTNDVYNKDSIKKNFNPLDMGTETIGEKNAIWFTTELSANYLDPNKILSYAILTPGVNINSTVFSLNSHGLTASNSDIGILKEVIRSYKIIETGKSIDSNNINSRQIAPSFPVAQ